MTTNRESDFRFLDESHVFYLDGTDPTFFQQLQLATAAAHVQNKHDEGLPTTWRDHLMVRVRTVCASPPASDDLDQALRDLAHLIESWRADRARRTTNAPAGVLTAETLEA